MRGTLSPWCTSAPSCWKRPSLLGWELLWRWGFGIPAAAILFYQGAHIAASVSLDQESLSGLSLSDPLAGWTAADASQPRPLSAAVGTPPSGWDRCWPWPGRLRPGWAATQCCSALTRHCARLRSLSSCCNCCASRPWSLPAWAGTAPSAGPRIQHWVAPRPTWWPGVPGSSAFRWASSFSGHC